MLEKRAYQLNDQEISELALVSLVVPLPTPLCSELIRRIWWKAARRLKFHEDTVTDMKKDGTFNALPES